MIYKRCGRCGKRIESGTTCQCYNREKRIYRPAEGIRKEYHSQRWKDLRTYVMSQYNGIDIYMLYKYGKVVPADTVHHIMPTCDSPGLFYSSDNLMPVSRQGHAEIHDRYKQENQEAVIEELMSYTTKYRDTGGM